MIDIRKLAAMDMALHGVRLITAEYALGIVFPLVLTLLPLRLLLAGAVATGWQALSAAWLVGVAVNYIPLFAYALLIARAGTVQQEGRPEFARARLYNVQQLLLLVPFLVAAAALVQERLRGRRPDA